MSDLDRNLLGWGVNSPDGRNAKHEQEEVSSHVVISISGGIRPSPLPSALIAYQNFGAESQVFSTVMLSVAVEQDTLLLMKRDMDLVRAILLEVEKQPDDGGVFDVAVPGHSDAEIYAHVRLLDEAGLIEAIDLSTMDGTRWKPKRLTWFGHEFLDAYRSETIWNRGKELVLKAGGGLTLEGLKLAIPVLFKNYMGLAGI